MPNMLVMFKVKGQYGRLIGNFTSVKDVQGTVYAVNDEIRKRSMPGGVRQRSVEAVVGQDLWVSSHGSDQSSQQDL